MNKTYYIYSNGSLSRKDNTLQFVSAEGGKKDIPVETVSDLYLMGEVSLNTKLLNFLSQQKITLHIFNYYEFYAGSYYPKEYLQAGALLVKQVEHYAAHEKRLYLAQQFIAAAADNIYRNLRYYATRGSDLEDAMSSIDRLRRSIRNTRTIAELMGVEGNIRQIYYAQWNEIINQDIDFNLRVKQPPDNMINSLISFVNSLVYTRALSEIYHSQLNPTISYLHEPGTRRFSLSLDLAEIFKPLIGDRMIFALLNRRQITPDDFDRDLNYLRLKKNAAIKITQEFDERLKKTILHRELKRHVSYQHLMRLECYKLVKHLIGENDYQGFRIWW